MSVNRLFYMLGLDRLARSEHERIEGRTFLVLGGTHDTGLAIASGLKDRGAARLLLGGRRLDDGGHFNEARDRLGDIAMPIFGNLSNPDEILGEVKACLDSGVNIGGVIDAASAGLFKVMYYLARERVKLDKQKITVPEARKCRYLEVIEQQNREAFDKAYLMNVTAHERILDELPHILPRGSIYVYVSSLFSSFIGEERTPIIYQIIADTKGGFEEALHNRAGGLLYKHGISTAVVTGDLLEDTETRKGFDDFRNGFPEFSGDFTIDHPLPTTGDMREATLKLLTDNRRNWNCPRYLYVIGPNRITENREAARKVVQSYRVKV